MSIPLEEGIRRLYPACTEEQTADLLVFLRELERWNRAMNLVGGGDRPGLEGHLLDCLAALPVLWQAPAAEAADAGSGGGFPGIPLAICMPETRMTLIERSGKKAAFLRNAAALLSCRERIRVLQEDLREVDSRFDLVVSRALSALGPGYDLLWPLTAPGGRLVFYKGKAGRIEEEMAGLKAPARIVGLTVPGGEGERHLVVFTKNQ